ncbi:PorP/SprF family type IX secretion system membrane protein [Compostibacter hankyongensis]|uniref:Type IX secretion system membrane protein PorP/SprF n=1 Tax=Compostibacter hankyongensis TaxID=1007089 RepID=A0ABP8FI67_9BACT
MRNLLLLPLFTAVVLLCNVRPAGAQDQHFTQFFASPLTLNPGFTGLFNGDFRVAGNYRNQWYTLSTPFVTGTVSADFDILKNTIAYNDIWGVGVLAMYDQTGGGGLRSNYLGLSTAYHKGLDEEGRQTLALGLQIALSQKRLDLQKLSFENQLTNMGFNPTLPSGEYFNRTSLSYVDYNVGLLYNAAIGEADNLYFGASYYHITEPDEAFLKQADYLKARYTLHGGGGFVVSEAVRVYASALYMQQGGAQEINTGGALGLVVNKVEDNPTIFYIGGWYRWNDAISPYIGLEVGSFQAGMSYDINISDLSPASHYQGGLELSLIYIHQHRDPNRKKLVCPKF